MGRRGRWEEEHAAQRAAAAAASADASSAARAEARRQAQLEEEAFAGVKKGPAKKVTAFELQQGHDGRQGSTARQGSPQKAEQKIQDEDEYEKTVMRENENRSVGVVSGSGMDAALDALTIGERSRSPARSPKAGVLKIRGGTTTATQGR